MIGKIGLLMLKNNTYYKKEFKLDYKIDYSTECTIHIIPYATFF